MKKTLIALALGALFASCGGGGNDQTVALQKQVDSLTAIVGGNGHKTMATLKQGRALFTKKEMNFSNGDPVDNFLVPWSYAGWSAYRWDRFLNNSKYRDSVLANSPSCYFVLPASNMQLVTDTMGMQYVVVYLTIDKDYHLTLMYVGANPSSNPQNDTIYEQPIIGADQQQFLLNHVWPCPQCAVDGLNTHEQEGN